MAQAPTQINSVDAKLREVIEQLYKAFAKYPLNPGMDGSPLYHELAQWNRALASKPLRELSEEDLRVYYFKAMTTWGGINDFKHFLPRILELLSALPSGFDEWVTLDKLNYGGYKTWPELEQAAISQFLLTLWRYLLVEKLELIDAFFGDYFSALANVYPDFKKLLVLWTEAENQEAWQRLASFFSRNKKKILKKKMLPGNQDLLIQGQLFFEWISSASVINRLKQVVSSEAYPYLELELIPVIQYLEQQ